MQHLQRNYIFWTKGRIIAFQLLLVTLKVIIQISLFQNGFISVSADEFARGIRAAQWAQYPSIDVLFDVNDVWLPFEKYLNGSILLIWPDTIWAPRLTVFIASCLLSIVLFFLVYEIFSNYNIAALSSLFLIVQPWYAWLSGTPMLEMYYLVFFFTGVYLFIFWVNRDSKGFWFLAGLCFMVSTGFHVQSWVYVNLFNLITVLHLIKCIKQKDTRKIIQLFGFYFLANSIILFYSGIEFLNTGSVFGFLNSHTTYSKWFYSGYNEPILDKALYYPKLIINNLSTSSWILFFTAILFLFRDHDRNWKILPLIFSSLALTTNSVMNLISVPPTAAPGRYSIIYTILISPYLAYAIIELVAFLNKRPSKIFNYAIIGLSTILFIHSLVWGFQRLLNYPKTISIDAINTGIFIRKKLNQYPENNIPKYMVELVYWEFLGVEAAAGYNDFIVYDREYDIYNRNTLSIFSDETTDPLLVLISQNVRFLALNNSDIKNSANNFSYLLPIQEIGNWIIYEVIE